MNQRSHFGSVHEHTMYTVWAGQNLVNHQYFFQAMLRKRMERDVSSSTSLTKNSLNRSSLLATTLQS